jgi:phosphatidylserine/phosphatidylglycerophosphate/cardiolipin synthase-like enzyme
LKRHMAIEQVVAGTPLYAGNKAAILQDGYQTFPAMFAAIRGASRSIYLEYYIFDDIAWQGTRLDELLISKSTSGLEVAIIYDGIGSLGTSRDFLNSLSAAGIRLLPFNPLNPLNSIHPWSLNNRDHRKILIADDRVAIVGGVNMATFYEDGPTGSDRKPYWRDTDIEISGPAVSELSRLFRDQWTQQGGAPLAYIDAKSDSCARKQPGVKSCSTLLCHRIVRHQRCRAQRLDYRRVLRTHAPGEGSARFGGQERGGCSIIAAVPQQLPRFACSAALVLREIT